MDESVNKRALQMVFISHRDCHAGISKAKARLTKSKPKGLGILFPTAGGRGRRSQHCTTHTAHDSISPHYNIDLRLVPSRIVCRPGNLHFRAFPYTIRHKNGTCSFDTDRSWKVQNIRLGIGQIVFQCQRLSQSYGIPYWRGLFDIWIRGQRIL